MKTSTSDLTGTTLDWAVAKCEGYLDDCNSWLHQATLEEVADSGSYHPSTDWAYGGPIIEHAAIQLGTQRDEPGFRPDPKRLWHAQMNTRVYVAYGPTPLVAAMRCYVASRLGNTVDVPGELMEVPMKA